jgi:hypothetical protein
VVVRFDRRIEQINRFKIGREGLKAREIEKRYPPEKAKKLMSLLRAKNLFYWDEDFPGDEEDWVKHQLVIHIYG